MVLIYVQSRRIIGRLIPSPWRSCWHILVSDETAVAGENVRVAAHTIPPVRRILDVLGSRQSGRHVVDHAI